jgi:hypothetical protein
MGAPINFHGYRPKVDAPAHFYDVGNPGQWNEFVIKPKCASEKGKSGRRSRRDMSATRCQWEKMSSLRTMMESIRLMGGSFIIEDGNQMSLTQQSLQEARQQ